MNGVDSLGSNQECRIGYKHSHSRVPQCLASIRKLGNRRSSEGNLYSCPQEVKEAAYKALVRPVLDYGSSVLDPQV